MSNITVDFATYSTYTTNNGPYDAGDNVTLADTSTVLDGLTTAQIDALYTNNVDTVSATDGVLAWDADQWSHLIQHTVAIDPDTFAILSDTGANIGALSAAQFTGIADEGVTSVNPSDGVLSLSASQLTAITDGGMNIDAGATVTLADTGANIAALSVAQFGALSLEGVDVIDATNDVLSLSVAQYQALSTVTLTASDTVTLADTGANISALSSADFGNLHGNGIDVIDASDNVLTLSLAQYNNLDGTTLTAADTITLADSGGSIGALSTGQIAALGTAGIDVFDATDNALSLTVAKYNQTVTSNIALTASDTVTLGDTGTNIAALTAGQISALVNVDVFDASDDALILSVAQLQAALGNDIALTAGDTVTIHDTFANIGGGPAYASLAGDGVDFLDATTAANVTVQNIADMGTVAYTSASNVTLVDSGTNVAGVSDFSTFASHGVDVIDTTDNTLTISKAQFAALGTTGLTAGDSVTISDTAANLGALTFSALAGKNVDFLNATTAISVTAQNVTDLGAVHFTAGSSVTLADTGSNIRGISDFSTLATHGVDTIDASDNALTISTTQFGALGAVTLTAADSVTISDSATNLSGLTFSALAGKNVDFLDSTTAYTTLTAAQLSALGTVAFTGASNVTLTDSGSNIAGVSDFSTFASHGVDTLDANNDTLTISKAQFSALGTTALTVGDTVTISDTAANLGALTFSALAGKNVDLLNATTAISVTVQNVSDLGAVHFTAGSSVTLADTGTHIAAVGDFSTFATHGVDSIDASDNALSISVTQYNALGSTTLTAADTVTLADTAANLQALSAGSIGALSNIDVLHVTDSNTLLLSKAQLDALSSHSIALTAADTVEFSDSEATLEALSNGALAGYVAQGVDVFHATGGTLNLSVGQTYAIVGNGSSFLGADTVTLVDTSAHIDALSVNNLSKLAGAHVDAIDASDNIVNFSVAQFNALGSVALTTGDTVTLTDTGAHLATLTFSTLAAKNVDALDASDNMLSISVSQYNGLGSVALTAGDTVTISDTAANITSLDFSTLAGKNIDVLDISDAFTLDYDRYATMGAVTFSSASNVTLQTDNVYITALTTAQIKALSANGIDTLESLGGQNNFTWTAAQADALVNQNGGGHVGLAATETVFVTDTAANLEALSVSDLNALGSEGAGSIVFTASSGSYRIAVDYYQAVVSAGIQITDAILADTGTNIAALSATDFGDLYVNGITKIDATNNVLAITVAQYLELGGTQLTSGDTVTLSDTGANIATLSVSQIGALAGNHVDLIDSSDNMVSLTVAQFQALGTVGLKSTDTVTLADTDANLSSLTASQISALASKGVDQIDSTDGTIHFTVAQFNALGVVTLSDASDVVTIADTGAKLATLDFSTLAAKGVDFIDSTTNALTLTTAQFNQLGSTQLTQDDVVTLSDTGANLAALDFATLAVKGIDKLDATDDVLSLTVAKYQSLDGITIASNDTVTLADIGSNISALSASDIGALHGNGVDVIDATDNALSLSLAQFNNLSGVTLTGADTVTLADAGATLGALSSSQIGALGAAGIDKIDATNNALTFNLAQYQALGSVTLTLSDAVTLSDTQANLQSYINGLSGAQQTALGTGGIDTVSASDGSLHFAQGAVDALAAGGATFDTANTVAMTATSAGIHALTGAQIASYATDGVDTINVTDTSVGSPLTLSVSQITPLLSTGTVFKASNFVTVQDNATNIHNLTAVVLGQLADHGVDTISAGGHVFAFNVAQYHALGAMTIDSADTVILSDTAGQLATLTDTDYANMVSKGIDRLDAGGGAYTIDVADYTAIHGSVTVQAGDTITLADTGSNLAAQNFAALDAYGIDVLDATDNALTISLAQYDSLGAMSLTAGDTVTLSLTDSDFSGLSDSDLQGLAGANIDLISDQDGTLTVGLQQLSDLGSVGFAAGTVVTWADSESTFEQLSASALAGYLAQGVDVLHASDTSTMNLGAASIEAVLASTAVFRSGDTVTLVDTGANIAAMTTAQFAALAAHGVDAIDASDNVLSLTVAQYQALGAVTLTAADAVTLADSGAHLSALTAAQIGALTNIDVFDATDNAYSLTVAQYNALGSIALAGADTVTLADTGANLAALSTAQIAALAGNGIDAIDATDNALTLTQAQVDSLGSVALTGSDTVTMNGAEASIESLSTGQIRDYADKGVDVFHASDTSALNLTVAQLKAMFNHGASLYGSDTVKVVDTGANVGALSASFIGQLAAGGVDLIDTTDNALTLSLAQYQALGDILIAKNDTLTVNGTSGNDLFSGHSGADILNGGAGSDVIDGLNGNDVINGGAGNDVINGGAGIDTLDYSDATAAVTVNFLTGVATGGAGTDIFSNMEGVIGSAFDDTFVFGDQITAASTVNGGAGNDTVALSGDYSGAHALVMTATTMTNVETIGLGAGHSYTLTTNDATVAAGQTLTVDGSSLGAGDVLNFDGSAELDGKFVVTGGAGDDVISTGNGNDTINGGAGNDTLRPGGGIDTVSGGAGDDVINFTGGHLVSADAINGGGGNDVVRLDGDYTLDNSLFLTNTTLVSVEKMKFDAGASYDVTTADGTVSVGHTLTVDASALGAGNSLTFDGSAETDGHFKFFGGLGGDTFTGGAMSDTFFYNSAALSSGTSYDTINGFDFGSDRFNLPGHHPVSGIGPALSGALDSGVNFNSELAADIGGHLHANHAELLTVTSGSLAGETFLIVDMNGTAGYQAGEDLVIHLVGATGTLTTGDFI